VLLDFALQMPRSSLPAVGGAADVAGEKDEFVRIGHWHQRGYSKVWSLLNVSMTTLGNAAPFFTARRVFQSKLLT
jgi:hypothetical protein